MRFVELAKLVQCEIMRRGDQDGAHALTNSFIDDPEHWRNRAEEARTLADQRRENLSK